MKLGWKVRAKGVLCSFPIGAFFGFGFYFVIGHINEMESDVAPIYFGTAVFCLVLLWGMAKPYVFIGVMKTIGLINDVGEVVGLLAIFRWLD